MGRQTQTDDALTAKHGATTEWMEANGECLADLEEGDIVHVIDEGHASTDTETEYTVTNVPSMDYDFHYPAIRIVEVGTIGPAVTIAPGKVSTTAQR